MTRIILAIVVATSCVGGAGAEECHVLPGGLARVCNLPLVIDNAEACKIIDCKGSFVFPQQHVPAASTSDLDRAMEICRKHMIYVHVSANSGDKDIVDYDADFEIPCRALFDKTDKKRAADLALVKRAAQEANP